VRGVFGSRDFRSGRDRRIRCPGGRLELSEPSTLGGAQIVAARPIGAALQLGDIGIEFRHIPTLSASRDSDDAVRF
jgi:hypothetical protein